MRWRLQLKGAEKTVEVLLERIEGDHFFFDVGGEKVELTSPRHFPYSISTNELALSFESWNRQKWRATSRANTYSVKPLATENESKSNQKEIRSQMPGRILKVLVEAGAKIQADQPLVIIEAMKMENEIRSSSAAKVKTVAVQAGREVESGALLLELE